jgi:hypothetical protein
MPETAQQYTQRLLSHVEGKDALRHLQATPKKLTALIKGKKKDLLARRPAPGKWSVAEILAHLADSELATSWRFRQILSTNAVPIQAYDQDSWANTLNYARRDPRRSLATFQLLRENNVEVLKKAPRKLWDNYGLHEERGQESIIHLTRMVAGHDTNHLLQIEAILKKKSK